MPEPSTDAAAALVELRRSPWVEPLIAACGPTPCHLVGGALRDGALGLPNHDLDVIVAGRGRQIAEALAAALPARLVLLGGKEFAAYRLVIPGAGAIRGADGEASGGAAAAEPEVIDIWDREASSLDDDLARRDFTIDSFAIEARSGTLYDPFGGLADLQGRILRATTGHSFRGDPLRVLRLARLLVQLPGFRVDPATLDLARHAVAGLATVAAERIRDEIWRLLAHREAARGLGLLAELGVYPQLWLSPGSLSLERPLAPPTASGDHGPGGRDSGDGGAGGGADDSEPGSSAPDTTGLGAKAPGTAEFIATGPAPGGVGRDGKSVEPGAAAAVSVAMAEIAALPACAAMLARWLAEGVLPHVANLGGKALGPSEAGADATGQRGEKGDGLPAPADHSPQRPREPAPPGRAPEAAIDLTTARFAATLRALSALGGAPAAAATAQDGLTRLQAAGIVAARQAERIRPLLAAPATLPDDELGRRRFLHRHGLGWSTVAVSFGGAAAAEVEVAARHTGVDTVRNAHRDVDLAAVALDMAAATIERAAAEGPAAGGEALADGAAWSALAAWTKAAAALCHLARREGPALIEPPRLLDGDDVRRLLGIAPGPTVGRVLTALTGAQVDGEVHDRDEAERFVRAWQQAQSGAVGAVQQ